MDKAVIIGAFEFIGFYFCQKLLEEGYQVTGIHFENERSQEFEEKKLEIGRNANFHEQTFEEWKNGQDQADGQQAIIISMFDLFMGYKDSIIKNKNMMDSLKDFIKKGEQLQNSIVLLLPIQLLSDQRNTETLGTLAKFLQEMNEPGGVLYFYLPAVYGPWQPSTYFFQKWIQSQDAAGLKENYTDREWKNDALYIHDVLAPMLSIIEKGESGHFLFESGEMERWQECFSCLTSMTPEHKGEMARMDLQPDPQIRRVILPKLTSVSESLEKQKQHYERFNT